MERDGAALGREHLQLIPGYDGSAMAERDVDAAVDELLRRQHSLAGRDHPGLALEFEAYRERVVQLARRRLERLGQASSSRALLGVVERAFLRDLFLSIACDRGVPSGWERLAALYLPRLRGLSEELRLPSNGADELLASLPGFLFMSPPGAGARTQLGTYDGSGSLFSWLAVVFRRLAAADRRASHGERAWANARAFADPDETAAPSSSRATDPLEQLLDHESAGFLEQGLVAAFEHLTANEAIAVILKFRDGLAQHRIATELGVGEPRVSALLDRARVKIRSVLGSRAARTPVDLSDPATGIRSQLSAAVASSLERLALAARSTPEESRHER